MNNVQTISNKVLVDAAASSQKNVPKVAAVGGDSFKAAYDRAKSDVVSGGRRKVEDKRDVEQGEVTEIEESVETDTDNFQTTNENDEVEVRDEDANGSDLNDEVEVQDEQAADEEEVSEEAGVEVSAVETTDELAGATQLEEEKVGKGEGKESDVAAEGKAGTLKEVNLKATNDNVAAVQGESRLNDLSELEGGASNFEGEGEGGDTADELLMGHNKSEKANPAGATNANADITQNVGGREMIPTGKVDLPDGMEALKDAKGIANTEMKTESNRDAINTARITRGIENAVKQRGGSLTIRMTPPEMGLVKLELDLSGGTVTARIQTEHESVRSMLNQKLSQLQSALEGQGLQVDKLSVQSMNSSSASSFNEHQEDAMSDGRSKGNNSRRGGQGQGRNEEGQSFEQVEQELSEALS